MNKEQLLKEYIEEMISGKLSSWEDLLSILEYREVKKGDLIVKESQDFKHEA